MHLRDRIASARADGRTTCEVETDELGLMEDLAEAVSLLCLPLAEDDLMRVGAAYDALESWRSDR